MKKTKVKLENKVRARGKKYLVSTGKMASGSAKYKYKTVVLEYQDESQLACGDCVEVYSQSYMHRERAVAGHYELLDEIEDGRGVWSE